MPKIRCFNISNDEMIEYSLNIFFKVINHLICYSKLDSLLQD
ncbi:hypothetical protein AM1_D0080 (plasmid) [Acaryochloris marina MBIC11017]|uniref:Uncharacterized protein n=1 Tax=Acaryochloris marina (strain MBIC 11017) TaxID=329726 RepID=A8ZNI9_ACAM1|nr:hypothetical protein AM1_D0080 [Acaryochloris marina MBIC11017]